MAIDTLSALVFLPPALVIGLWVAWSDLRRMKIPNLAVYALFLAFLVLGPFALDFGEYLWRIGIALAVLVIGFVLNQLRALGAGDAKFIAAMAPFVDPQDLNAVILISLSCFLAAFVTHRLFRAIPGVRGAMQDWESWSARKFPMGLALGGILIIYLALGAWIGR